MKSFYKQIALCLAVLMLLLSVVSCGGPVQEPSDVEPALPEATLAVEDLKSYRFIYPKKSSSKINDALTELSKKINELYGVRLLTYGDSDRKEDAKEILVGVTNRAESGNFAHALKYEDYGFRMVGTKLLISGVTEESTLNAISAFTKKVLAQKGESFVFSNTEHAYLCRGTYDLDGLTIGGTDISEYTVVYPKSGKGEFEQQSAETLRDAIAQKCGVYLSVISDETASTGKEILVGKTNRNAVLPQLEEEEYFYSLQSDGNLVIFGGSAASISYSAKQLAKRVKGASAKELSIAETKETVTEIQNTVMSWNLCSQHALTPSRLSRYVALIHSAHPDVVFFQECNEGWSAEIAKALGGNYADVELELDGFMEEDISNKGFLYDKSVLKPIFTHTFWLSDTPDVYSQMEGSSGARACVYVIFERLADGQQFAVFDFHPEYTGSNSKEIRLKQYQVISNYLKDFRTEHSGMPILMGGDLNAVAGEAILTAIENDGFSNAGDVAFKKTVGSTYPAHDSVIDYLYGDSKTVTFLEYRVYDLGDKDPTGTGNPSDHNPLMATFRLN